MGANLVAGDTGSVLEVTCKDDATSAVIDLTGGTVKVHFRINGGALVTKTMTISSPATAGKATYQFLGTELKVGKLQAEIEITDSGGKIITSLSLLFFVVRKKL